MTHIKIVPFDKNWQSEYLKIEAKLKSILKTSIIRIDHIGSTSVKDLSAKDIIDVQITVDNLQQPNLIDALVAENFEYFKQANCDNLVGVESDCVELKKLFFKYQSNKIVHVHVREKNRLNQCYPILFRDYLRANPKARLAYEKIKKELAWRFEFDATAYYAIKDPVMDGIYYSAQIWAKSVGWQLDN